MPAESSPAAQIRALQILHLAMIAGVVVLCSVCFFIRRIEPIFIPGIHDVMQYSVAGALLLGLAGSRWVYRWQLERIDEQHPLDAKLAAWRSAQLVRLAMAEFPALLAAVGYLLTGRVQFLVVAVAVAGFMWAFRPEAGRAAEELPLTPDEEALF